MLSRAKNPTTNTLTSHLEPRALVYRLAKGPSRVAVLDRLADLSNTGDLLRLEDHSLSLDGTHAPNTADPSKLPTSHALLRNRLLGSYAPFVKTFIIRGIGYQAGVVENGSTSSEFPYSRYLVLRVGHSFNLYKPIPNYIGVRVSCKDRKLVIYGSSKEQVSNYARTIFKLRGPSVYTGRGIRFKRYPHRRKLGKKDVRKGKV
jgi:ribosomal protein L6P/L9E